MEPDEEIDDITLAQLHALESYYDKKGMPVPQEEIDKVLNPRPHIMILEGEQLHSIKTHADQGMASDRARKKAATRARRVAKDNKKFFKKKQKNIISIRKAEMPLFVQGGGQEEAVNVAVAQAMAAEAEEESTESIDLFDDEPKKKKKSKKKKSKKKDSKKKKSKKKDRPIVVVAAPVSKKRLVRKSKDPALTRDLKKKYRDREEGGKRSKSSWKPKKSKFAVAIEKERMRIEAEDEAKKKKKRKARKGWNAEAVAKRKGISIEEARKQRRREYARRHREKLKKKTLKYKTIAHAMKASDRRTYSKLGKGEIIEEDLIYKGRNGKIGRSVVVAPKGKVIDSTKVFLQSRASAHKNSPHIYSANDNNWEDGKLAKRVNKARKVGFPVTFKQKKKK